MLWCSCKRRYSVRLLVLWCEVARSAQYAMDQHGARISFLSQQEKNVGHTSAISIVPVPIIPQEKGPVGQKSFALRSDISGLDWYKSSDVVQTESTGMIFLKDCGFPAGFGGLATSSLREECQMLEQSWIGSFLWEIFLLTWTNPAAWWVEPYRCLQVKALVAAALDAPESAFEEKYLKKAMAVHVFELNGPLGLFWNTDRRWANLKYSFVVPWWTVGGLSTNRPMHELRDSAIQDSGVS